MKKIFASILLLIFFKSIFSQENMEIKTINWLSFEEVGQNFVENQKPIMVYLYENENDSCQMMFNETFMNDEVVNYLDILFYSIKYDVTTNDSVTFFDGRKFGKQSDKKYNDFVYSLIGDSIQTPALLIFNINAQGSYFSGFKDRDHIFPILIYFNEKIYKSVEYQTFEDYYFKAYPVGQQQIMTRLIIKWKTFDEMLEAQEQKPKKVLIDIYNNYSIAATMMRTKTFNDPIIANYLNQNYYCTTVEARGNQEFTIKDIPYKNSGESHGYHEFAIAVLQGQMNFPAFIILDEEFNLLDRIQYYVTPEMLEPIVKYYGSDSYKTATFQEFQNTFESEFIIAD